MTNEKDNTGLWILVFYLLLFVIIVSMATGFNPFRNCQTFTNSTFIMDCWFA